MLNLTQTTHEPFASIETRLMVSHHEPPTPPRSGLAGDVADLARVAARDRWGLGLMAVGWVHLAIFLACHLLYAAGDRAESHVLPLWGLDLGAAILILRRTLVKPGGGPSPTLLRLLVRVWVTFLIVAFSAATLNSLVGFETDWFKAAWANLATFGFAMMAWILHLGFLIPAVQMSLTALLIARYPDFGYLIYGASGCLALNGVGLALERRGALGRPGREARGSRMTAVGQAVRVGQ